MRHISRSIQLGRRSGRHYTDLREALRQEQRDNSRQRLDRLLAMLREASHRTPEYVLHRDDYEFLQSCFYFRGSAPHEEFMTRRSIYGMRIHMRQETFPTPDEISGMMVSPAARWTLPNESYGRSSTAGAALTLAQLEDVRRRFTAVPTADTLRGQSLSSVYINETMSAAGEWVRKIHTEPELEWNEVEL